PLAVRDCGSRASPSDGLTMSLLSRLSNVFRQQRLNRELDEEMDSHIADAIEAGRDPAAARRAFGSTLRYREQSRDFLVLPWLDSLRADIRFGFAQLRRSPVVSTVAVLTLALGLGACISAFRLMDALLFRSLPVA